MRLLSSLKLEINLTVRSFFGMMNMSAPHSDLLTFLIPLRYKFYLPQLMLGLHESLELEKGVHDKAEHQVSALCDIFTLSIA